MNTLMTQTGSSGGGGLTPDAFAHFLRWLAEDIELALKRYWVVRKKLVNFFVRKGCLDPHELFDKTVDVVVRKIDAGGEYTNQEAYCYGVARNIWLEHQRAPNPDPLVTDNIPSPHNDEREQLERKLKCLEGCMEELSPRSRDLITRYYQNQGRQKIESENSWPRNTAGRIR